jgi:hypothetical protein
VKQEGAFLLRRQEVTTLLGLGVCITAVERSFKYMQKAG